MTVRCPGIDKSNIIHYKTSCGTQVFSDPVRFIAILSEMSECYVNSSFPGNKKANANVN